MPQPYAQLHEMMIEMQESKNEIFNRRQCGHGTSGNVNRKRLGFVQHLVKRHLNTLRTEFKQAKMQFKGHVLVIESNMLFALIILSTESHAPRRLNNFFCTHKIPGIAIEVYITRLAMLRMRIILRQQLSFHHNKLNSMCPQQFTQFHQHLISALILFCNRLLGHKQFNHRFPIQLETIFGR